MKYVTIVDFTDKYTGDVYYVGDKYPLKGKAKKARLDELASSSNQRKIPLIKEVSEDE
ncbi:hypothetical protein RR45_GL000184 [Lactococcus chungangensis CAU 28 = DSM 22330]|uniref:Uncharacterized protein n=1 Tax=Pseudolactococcus chungangensis CAU 28 = DSM 22330 TaxID=1122154 RepID=A0A1K2HBV9_9LACT|nr:hypothetical protein [Lactococcus chungangensis]PCS04865.1 hypothetical protein RR45_GL000184 [Lactococcus chungangensis CAU 28 = DSM 22330]SFZ74017.1 hypothetical protein SAMN02746068_01048 [Lactococcus chungangensis CAU 28 = DSM 22330]